MPYTADQFKNNATSRLVGGALGGGSGLSVVDTVFTIIGGDGATFSAVSPFMLALGNLAGTYELVQCTNRAGDSFTVLRGQEGTLAQAWPVNTPVTEVITAGSLTNLWQHVANLPFNVRDFGAKGDGVTDDTLAITTALNAANAAGGGRVYFPAGRYITGPQPVYSHVYYDGAGEDATIIQLKNNANADLFSAFTTNMSVNSRTSSTGSKTGVTAFGFQNLTLDGNYSNQSAGPSWPLRFYGYGYLLENVTVKNGYSGGIQTDWNGSLLADNRIEATWHNVRVYNSLGTATSMGIEWGEQSDGRWTNVLSYINNGTNLHVGPHGGALMMTGCHTWNANQNGLDPGSCSALIEAGVYLANCEFEGSDHAQVVLLANSFRMWGGGIFAVDHAGLGLQIGQQGGQLPWTGSANQSGGVSLATPASGYNIHTSIFGVYHTAGAINFAFDQGGTLDCDILAHSTVDTIYTGSPAVQTMLRLNNFGFSDPRVQINQTLGQTSYGHLGTVSDPGNGGTIATAGLTVALINPASAETGLILQSGSTRGQLLYVMNLGNNTATFAAQATSNVYDGTADSIPPKTTRGFLWEVGTNVWVRIG